MIFYITIYYMLVFVVVGIAGSILIDATGSIYDTGYVLKEKSEFIRCVFMYQFALYAIANEDINLAGIIILEIFTTFSVWFLNIFVFVVLIVLLILKGICFLFWLIFRKRNKQGEE